MSNNRKQKKAKENALIYALSFALCGGGFALSATWLLSLGLICFAAATLHSLLNPSLDEWTLLDPKKNDKESIETND